MEQRPQLPRGAGGPDHAPSPSTPPSSARSRPGTSRRSPQGRRFVWAMGADGRVPLRRARGRTSRGSTPPGTLTRASIVGEGAFVDRQDFLRQLIQESEEPGPGGPPPDPDDPDVTPWSGSAALRRSRRLDGVLRAPAQAPTGSALGNLYLKMENLEGRWEPWADSSAESLLRGLPPSVSAVAAGCSSGSCSPRGSTSTPVSGASGGPCCGRSSCSSRSSSGSSST